MRIIATVSVVSVLALAACSSYAPPPPRIVPLAPQPVNPVMSQALPAPVAPTMSQPTTDMAMAQPTGPAVAPGVAADVRKADLIGGWTLASAGETCQLSMNLTTWSGGFRASTRGCVSDELKSIGAWDVAGKEILLKDASGSVVARLYAAAANRYSGQTDVSKRGVQFFRG